MAQDTQNQILELINKGKKILITTKTNPSGDGLASCLALKQILKKINKNSEIIIDNFTIPESYSFLPGINEVKSEVTKLKKFIINLDISQTGIDELSYDLEGSNLSIYLTPKQGVFTPDDLKFKTSEFAFDLIIIVGTTDLESLGKLYEYHRDFFYQVPVINIDNNPANDEYGHINAIDVTSTSSSEIIFNQINTWPEKIMDENIATYLLTGMISATKSFKTSNVTPKTLQIASELINAGAKRQEIITHLFQTKTINTLKLWGKILSRLQYDQDSKVIWSKLNPNDFTESNTSEKDVSGVIDDLISTSPLAEIVILFYQTDINVTKVLARSLGNSSIQSLTRSFSPTGDKNEAKFSLNKTLDLAEKEVINIIKGSFKK